MLPDLANHDAVEAVAVLLLLSGGATALGASVVFRNHNALTSPGASGQASLNRETIRRAVWVMLASASAGAGVIHLALGPSHFEEIGPVGLGFFVVGAAQLAWAAFAMVRLGRTLAWLAVGGNAAVLVAWAFTRLVGLPVGPEPWTPEGVGWADSVAGLFELAIVCVLLLDLWRRSVTAPRVRAAFTTAASVGTVPVVGAVVVLTTLALSSPEAGHQHMTMATVVLGALLPWRSGWTG